MSKTEEMIIKELVDRNIPKIGMYLGILITELGALRTQLKNEKVMSAKHYQKYISQKERYENSLDEANALEKKLKVTERALELACEDNHSVYEVSNCRKGTDCGENCTTFCKAPYFKRQAEGEQDENI